MERRISESKRRFLSDESRAWVDSGLISEGQRGGILESYIVARRLPAVVLFLGASMIGIGVLSFIASNWQALPELLRIAVIIGAYTASVAGAFLFETRGRRTASNLLLFLSGFLLLGGMALISQIFHIDGSVDSFLWTWLVVYAPTFLIVRDISVYVLYGIAAAIYMNVLYFHVIDDSGYWHGSRPDGAFFDFSTIFVPYQPLLLLVLLIGMAWWVWRGDRSTAVEGGSLLKRFFVGGSTRRIFLSNFLLINWFVWLCVLNSTGRTVLPFVFGVLAIGAVIIFMGRKLDASDLDWQGLLCVGVSGVALSFPSVWGRRYYSGESYLLESILSSAVLGAYLVYRIIHRDRGGGFAVFLFCALLVRWYFDMFYSFMSKSFFFITGGVLLLSIAYAYRKWNKMAGENPVASGASEDDGDDSE